MNPPTRMAGPDEGAQIFAPVSDDTVARMGEIAALRGIEETLKGMRQFLLTLNDRQDQFADKLGIIHTDVTVIKLQDERIRKVEEALVQSDKQKAETFARFDAEIQAIKLRHAEEEGGRKRMLEARDWAPYLLALAVAVVYLAISGKLHL